MTEEPNISGQTRSTSVIDSERGNCTSLETDHDKHGNSGWKHSVGSGRREWGGGAIVFPLKNDLTCTIDRAA